MISCSWLFLACCNPVFNTEETQANKAYCKIENKLKIDFFFPGKTSEQQNSYNFHFRGCGWKWKDVAWDTDEINWIRVMDKRMTMMFGGDFLDYDYNEKKICIVLEEYRPKYVYNREDWLSEYAQMVITSDDMCEGFEGWFCFVFVFVLI